MTGGSDVALGIAASVVAALLLATGTIVQALHAREVEHHHGLRLSLLGRLLSSRRWLAGTAIGYLAFPFQLAALTQAPLVVVQPVYACGLLLLLAAGARLFGEHVGATEWEASIAIVAGIVLVTWGAPKGRDTPVNEAALMAAVGVLVLASLAPYPFRERCGRHTVVLSAAAGFAAANLAVKGISHGLIVHAYAIAAAYLVLAAVGSTVAMLNQMTAFQRHRAAEVVPLTSSVPTFLPLLLGLVVLHEHWAGAALGGAPFGVGAAVVLVGVWVVSRSAPVASVEEHAAADPDPIAPADSPRAG
ncbi:MAG: hypothetical protein ACRDMX_00455 [Solirubrobacteraceae bacterium]